METYIISVVTLSLLKLVFKSHYLKLLVRCGCLHFSEGKILFCHFINTFTEDTSYQDYMTIHKKNRKYLFGEIGYILSESKIDTLYFTVILQLLVEFHN